MPAAATSITLIIAPYHMGLYDHRVGGGPLRILQHGIASELERLCPTVHFTNIGPVDSFEGEVGRMIEVLRRISTAVTRAVQASSFPIVLAGNCQASTAVAAGIRAADGGDLGFVWLDAHDDFDTPETNVNGYLDAMAVSMMAGMSWKALMATVPGHMPASLESFAYCGLRDVTAEQRAAVEEAGVPVVWGDAVAKKDYAKELGAVLEARGKGKKKTHVHFDLDVLDESLGRANDWPSPGGFLEEDALAVMGMLPQKTEPTSLVVCSFDPRLEGGDTVARLAVRATCRFVEGLFETEVLQRRS
ncbi:Arginase [Lasiodiplodia theobromae]|uniref:Arginase n=1 Tax=Lasiodiplodia theobromae TaxID=45133 RepID=A0A5N5CWC7_9PEZI|nr:Arginase [Lasiodiplodia theobromae]